MINLLQTLIRGPFDVVERVFSAVFSPNANPFLFLGTLSFYFFWIVAISGIYLYIFFETSISGAYDSIEYLTHTQWYLGGIMRSMHRYASDAMAVTVTLHLLREFSLDRYRGARWFSWITGAPLLWLLFASAIGGYWLVWDVLAQYIAVTTSEWLDWLPIFNSPMARNFLNEASVDDRLFSLLVFLHIGIPLALLAGMWIHIQRVSHSKTIPPRGLALGSLGAFLAMAIAKPALSQAPANLDVTVTNVGLDWFYLNIYPLFDLWSVEGVWLLLIAITIILMLLPWLPPLKKQPTAVVDPNFCNGCQRCYVDCPFGAITMKPHDFRPGHQQAVVNADQCTSCGICAGACPSSTPFRRVDELVSGIDLPQLTVQTMRSNTDDAIAALSESPRIVVFNCQHGAELSTLKSSSVALISLPCIGMLPPSFVDYVLRRERVDGVLITGCPPEKCYHRLGSVWTEQRVEGTREPHLRTKAAKARLRIRWAMPHEAENVKREVRHYQLELARDLSSSDTEQGSTSRD